MSGSIDVCQAVPRKRLKSVIRHDDPASIWRSENVKLFFMVLWVYLSVAFLPPTCSSNADSEARRYRATPVTIIEKVDLEKAIIRALGDDPAQIEQFCQWFIDPHIEPSGYLPRLTGESARMHSKMIQSCAGQFRRIGYARLLRHERLRKVTEDYFTDASIEDRNRTATS